MTEAELESIAIRAIKYDGARFVCTDGTKHETMVSAILHERALREPVREVSV